MEKKEKAPVLRFKDTNGKDYPAWEQRKLEDCATIIMGQSPKSENYTNDPKDHILVQGNADLKNGQVAPRVWTTEVTKIGKVGDIILSVRAPVGEVGKTAYDVVLGRGVAAIRGNDFLLQTLLKLKECKYWGKVSAGSTFDSITSEILKSTLISMPAIEEQIKIGDFLSSVDKLITLHQRKLEALKKLKRTLLQKMFPKKGHLKPELRFFGFTNDWELRKLGELGRAVSGVGFPEGEQGGIRGIPFYKVSDMSSTGNENIISFANNYVTEVQIRKRKWKVITTLPAILFAKVGAAINLNRKRLCNQPFLIDNNMMAFLLNPHLDSGFAKTVFEKINMPDFVRVGALPSIKGSDIECYDVFIPKEMSEQKKLGSFFKDLDTLITLHQRKLEIYKKLKKGLLQKMFI